MIKVKFRVYVTRRCRMCNKIHTMPTHRYLDHIGEGGWQGVVAQGHANFVNLLEKENTRAERIDRRNRKASSGRTNNNLYQRPLYQWYLEVE